jgi:lysophospholipase L1-like esterase
LLSAVYLLGAVTVYKQFFPFNQIVSLRNYLSGASLQPNPFWPERREQFLMYSHPADVVMIGDSITHAGHWEDIFPGVKIANRGVGSDKTYDVLQRMDSIYSVRPSKAFLMIGTNDFSVERSVEAVFSDYVSIVQALQDHKIEVYIQSTLECSVRVCGDRLYKIREFNRELESFAGSEKLIYIDINARMTSESDGLLAPYTYDGVHLLGKGYAEWRSAIASYIEAK